MNRVFLAGGLRSHIGIRNGIFKHIRPEVLGGRVASTLCQRYGIQGPDALICGNAVGPGGNIGRLLLLEGGLPERAAAFTIDLQCASGLAAIHMAALSIMAGEWDVVLAGGAESASLQPQRRYADNDERGSLRNPVFTAAQFRPGEFGDDAMLLGAERAAKAAEEGWLKDVILPLFGSSRDEALRKRMSEKLLTRAPRVTDFPEGILTAANTCTINDGAAFVMLASERWLRERDLVPSAEIKGFSMTGADPAVPPLSADLAVSLLLRDKGLFYSDLDAFEYNEAFAVISADFRKKHRDVADRLNRWGGALAYGHPYGASGAEIMIHLMKILEREEGNLGVAAIPAAGGVGEAVLIHHVDEREWTEERERHTAFSIPLEVKL